MVLCSLHLLWFTYVKWKVCEYVEMNEFNRKIAGE